MKRILALIAAMALLLGLLIVAAAEDPIVNAKIDASIFEAPENLSKAGFDGIECMDIDLGIYHLIPARTSGIGDYFLWTGTLEKMPANVEENDCCFTSATSAPATVIFFDGVPNLSKDLFKWWEGKTKDVYIPDSVTEIDEECFVEGSTITLHFTPDNAVALAYAKTHGMAYKIVPRKHFDASIFREPENLSEAGYDGIECMDIDLGLYHLIPARNGGTGDFFHWTGALEKMPANVEENDCCFTSATSAPATVIFFDGVPNLSKDLFKYWEGKTKDVYIPDSVTEIDEDAFVMNSTITLHFTASNEVALAYAQSRGMNYEIVPEAEEVSEPDVSELVSDVSEPEEVSEPTSPLSIFDGPANMDLVEIYECTCIVTLKLSHFDCDGFAYFAWCGGDGKMSSDGVAETCFADTHTTGIVYEKVVFINGVPNLPKDLFKAWESKTNDVYVPDSVTEIDEECFVKGSHITLHFTKNNEVALAYAQNRGMAFEIMDGERVEGDVNYDGSVDMKDVLALRKSIAHLPAAVEIGSSDVDGNGSVDMKDVLALRRKIARLDTILHRDFADAELGASVTVETYVQDKQIWINGKASFYTQSEDGAYFIYAMPCTQEAYDALTPGTKIRVSGIKSAWKDEVEITDATFEVLEGSFIAEPIDATALLGTDTLIAHQNEKVTFKGLTIESKTDPEGKEVAFLYNWNGVGGEGDDLYFDATVNGQTVTFTVESDLCGAETDVYKEVKALQIGDTIDLSCYLYWYDGPNPHVFAVTPAA